MRTDLSEVKALLGLGKRYAVSPEEMYAILQEAGDRSVPVSIFSDSTLSPLEVLVKYLRENKGMRLCEIAETVCRDQRVIGVTYRSVLRKKPAALVVTSSSHFFPLELLKEQRLSVFEHVVMYLRSRGLKYAEIAAMTGRDQRTIWTTARRAQQKMGVKSMPSRSQAFLAAHSLPSVQKSSRRRR